MIDPLKKAFPFRDLHGSTEGKALLIFKVCIQIGRLEVWRITHRIFTHLNEFVLVSTLESGWRFQ